MLQDTVVILAMFALRLGVPFAATLLICFALNRVSANRAAALAKKRGEQQKAAGQAARLVRQLHCWEIKRCDPETRPSCPAYQRQNVPCWLAIQLAGQQLSDECLTCSLYDLRKVA
jgi:hypothetical protein